jgi:inorganic triphosphatase YgiF
MSTPSKHAALIEEAREARHNLYINGIMDSVAERGYKLANMLEASEAEVARLQAQVAAVRASVKAMSHFDRHWESCDNIITALGDV